MSGRRSIVSVSRCDPSSRARAAGMASSKKSQTWPPRPERDRSRAAGRSQATARVEKGRGILAPVGLVEVDGQEAARLVLEAAGRRPRRRAGPSASRPRQMPADDLVGHRQEPTMRALGALDAGLLADAAHPLVRARGRIAGLAGLAALEATRIHVLAPAEERTEQRDLRVWWGRLVDHAVLTNSPLRRPVAATRWLRGA